MAQDEPAIPPSSPPVERRAAVVAASPGPRGIAGSSVGLQPPTRHFDELMTTPVRKSVSKLDLIQTPLPMQHADQQTRVSIYDKLGWDDEYDDI
jgi:hypothetical protein